MTKRQQVAEWIRCRLDPIHFIETHVQIEDPQTYRWFPFRLWPEQKNVVRMVLDNQKSIALKARQLGLTWLMIGLSVWYVVFQPGSSIALTSRRDKEATYLLGDRLKPVLARLPEWMRPASIVDNAHELRLVNGSVVRAFATGKGDSYTNTLVIVDEADLIDDLGKVLRAMEPTIDAGGKLVLISKVDKSRPTSEFKRIYRTAGTEASSWAKIFLSWHVRPERTQEWYDRILAECHAKTGGYDDVWENYPATDAQALAPRSTDKRIGFVLLNEVYDERQPLTSKDLHAAIDRTNEAITERNGKITDALFHDDLVTLTYPLQVFVMPDPDRTYVIGADPAEGNPNSDDSSLSVIDRETWEQVAVLSGKYEPSTFAAAIKEASRLYNGAAVLVERNNHGHAVLLWLRDNSTVNRLYGEDQRPGYLSTTKGKVMLYDSLAAAISERDTLIHDSETCTQIASIEGRTLRAPKGHREDRSDAHALAIMAAKRPVAGVS